MTELVSLWRFHAPKERFGQFIYNCVAESDPTGRYGPGEIGDHLHRASHAQLLQWARERFGIEP